MSRQGERAVFPPGFNTWPDFQKISWYAIEFDDKLSEIQDLNNHIRALKQKEQDALQDAYEFQDKAREWEKKYEEVKHQMDRFRTELPREVMFLRQTAKKAEKEAMLLQGGVEKRDESIQKLRSRLISAKEEYKTEIKLLDDIIYERNNEVNQLRENELELKADIQALDGCWKFEKGRADIFKVAAEKYDEAGPALERLNTILAKYLGDQLQDGLDWPPGHKNNKANMNRALDALDNELRKASLKPTLSVPPTPTTASKPPRAIDDPGRRNRVNSGGSDGSFRSPNFLAPGQRRRSDTNTSRNSVPPNTDKNLDAELGVEGLNDSSGEEEISFSSRSSVDSQRPGSPTLKKKGGFGNLKGRVSGVVKKGVKDFGKEIGIGLKNQSSTSAGPPPYNPSGNGLAKTPTNGKKRPDLGLRTSTDQGNANRRNISMFGNGTAPPEDDSPKPSDKVFADDRNRQRGSRFANKPNPTPEPIIEYRDKIIYKDKIVEIPVPMQCMKAHVEDQPLPSPMIREVEKKVMVPCSRDHLAGHICPTKEVEVVMEVTVPCYLDHVKDMPPVKPQIKEVIKEVIKEAPAQCTREHEEDLPPVRPSRCYLEHCNDHPPLEFQKVMVPCSRDHLADHTCPTPEPVVVYEQKQVMVPCSRDHLADHTCPVNEVEVVKEVNVPCYLDHVKDQPPVSPKIITKEAVKEVPAKCTKAHVGDQPPVKSEIREIEKVVTKEVKIPCYLDHVKDQPPVEAIIKEKKVMVPCSRDHLADHTCPTTEPEVVYEEKKVMVPCSRDHLADHICPTKEVKVPCYLDHVKDQPPFSPKVVYQDREVVKEVKVPTKCLKPHVKDQPPVSPKVVYKDRKVMVPCSRDHLGEDHICPEPKVKEVIKEKNIMVPCSRGHVSGIPAIEPKVITKEIEVPVPCTKPHLDTHTCPPPQIQTVEKIVETPVEVFVDRPIIQEKIVNKYINTTVYGPRNPLWTIFYIYFDLWTSFIAWMNQNSAFTRAIIDKFYSHLPGKLQDWCVTDPLVGRTFEVIDAANTYKTETNGRAALLKATKKPVENFDAETEAQNLYNEQDAKNEAKNVPTNLNPQPAKVDCKGKGNGSATGIDASTSAPLHNRKPTPPTPYLTDEGCLRSTLQSRGYEAEYVLATQYTIRRPPLFSNLLMGGFFAVFFIAFFLAGCVVREYSSLLKLQGIIRPSWFSQPWIPQTGGYRGGVASLRSGFVIDQDWSWVRYLWEAVARFGWLRQVHFYLETIASAGAGYRMPG